MTSKRTQPTREQWQRIEALFDRALDMDPAEREALLDSEWAGDAELKREVEALLAADSQAPTFLDQGLGGTIAGIGDDPASIGQVISAYRLIEEVGRGGMSIVYRAERADGRFDKQVAVKIVHGMGGHESELTRRFQLESQVLATLEHPNIAHVLDAGLTERDDPYLVMEYVDGRPITRYCAEQRLNLDQRLDLFAQVCEAVHHAHQRLVVHRDLKPSNILVAEPEPGMPGTGFVKLLDFGIAKLMDDSSVSGANQTRTGLFLMTPQYAAPEQIRGGEITTATDVYALGLLLYEMLVGEPPYDVEGRTPQEILRTICESIPARPSTRVTEHTAHRNRSDTVAVLRSRLRGDLDAIVLKALEKDPARRYSSPLACAQDIERYRKGLPVEAKPAGRLYLAVRFVRRNRLAVGVVVVVLALAIGAAVRERLNAERILDERDRADQLASFLVDIFGDADPAVTRGREVTARELLARGVARVDTDLAGKPTEQARLWSTIGSIYRNLGLLDDAVELQRRAVETGSEALGDDHPDVLKARARLGDVLHGLGDYDAAEAQLRNAVDGYTHILGADHELTLDSARALGMVLEFKGELDEAEHVLGSAVQGLERKLGARHELTLKAQIAMASVLYSAGAWDRAEAMYRTVLAGRRETLGADHPQTLAAYNDLSLLLTDMGRIDEATDQYVELLAMSERVFGPEHPDFLSHKNNLAIAYYRARRFEDAVAVMSEVQDTTVRLLGRDHPDSLNGLNNLAMIEQKLGQYDESFEKIAAAREGYARTLGKEHPQTLIMIHNLGATEVKRGRYLQARDFLQQALEARKRVLGEAHPHTVLTQIELGRAYTALGEFATGCRVLSGAVGLSESAYPAGHATVGQAKLRYGECLVASGQHADAEAHLLGAYEILQPASGEARREAALALAGFYDAVGQDAEARRYRDVAAASAPL